MNNKLLLLFITVILISNIKIYGQVTADSATVANAPDKKPEYKKGMKDWIYFLESNLDRDLLKRQGAPLGNYRVIASFLIDSVGGVSDIKIETDPGYGTADEVKRIMRLTDKKWTPANNKGIPITFRHKQSITFVNM